MEWQPLPPRHRARRGDLRRAFPHVRGRSSRPRLRSADGGCIMSSFGVGELGLHLCYETPRDDRAPACGAQDPTLARELFGECSVLPMVLAFNARRTLIEALDPDQAGYGRMTVSMLDPTLPVPLLRYQTGDIVRLLDPVAGDAGDVAPGDQAAGPAAGDDAGSSPDATRNGCRTGVRRRLQGRALCRSAGRRSLDRRLPC